MIRAVGIEGNVGAGKTRLSKLLCDQLRAVLMPEYMALLAPPAWALLQEAEPASKFEFFSYLDRARAALAQDQEGDYLIFDRTFLSVMAHEYALGEQHWRRMTTSLRKTDLRKIRIPQTIIFTSASIEVRSRRVLGRGDLLLDPYFDRAFSRRFDHFFSVLSGVVRLIVAENELDDQCDVDKIASEVSFGLTAERSASDVFDEVVCLIKP